MNLARTGSDKLGLLLVNVFSWDFALHENVAASIPDEEIRATFPDLVKMKDPHPAFTESVNDGGLVGVGTLGSQTRCALSLLDCVLHASIRALAASRNMVNSESRLTASSQASRACLYSGEALASS